MRRLLFTALLLMLALLPLVLTACGKGGGGY
jgi:predicted small lipoprotein YifL